MKTASLIIAALALTAGLAAAQTETSSPEAQTSSQSSSQSASPSSRRLGQPTRKGERAQVGKDVHKGQAAGKDRAAQTPTNAADVDRGARGTGVATGFVAAGIGLALLGLFVRKRGRHDYDDEGGSGTTTRM